ncbi:MAG: hypothetical protein KF819_06070 [Labilithrix sp.]|nr:hypothetical protein [Labilithrix sp.]
MTDVSEGFDSLPPLVLPPHPSVYLRDVASLKAYLRDRGVEHTHYPYGVSLPVDLGEIVDFTVDVQWLLDSVRFIAVTGLDVPPARLPELAHAVDRLDMRRGFPLWRVLPTLAAVYTVTRNHDDTISSRVFEYAFALLRDALVRDRPVLKELLAR